ncbi:MAG: efflux RND transporter periplasmic adaptor subunit, partial [Terriglobales bacterium]
PTGSTPAPAQWVLPAQRWLPQTITTTGTVRLRDGAQVRVGAQVSGIVSQLNVTVGARVQAGEVIARIDPRPLQAKLAQVNAAQQVAQVALAKARRDQQRGQALLAGGLIPRQQAEDLTWSLGAAEAQMANARADVASAQTDLAYTVLRAPVGGVVASVSTQPGETVAAAFASPTFVTIIQPHALELDGLVDETDIGNVRPGDLVQFTVESFPDRLLRATVTRIEPAAVIISGVVNYSVVARLASIPAFLRPDMTATLTIQTGRRSALTVPTQAVHRDGGGSFVWVRRVGGPRRAGVAVGERQPQWVEITSGLAAGDRVGVGGGAP